MAGIEGTMAFSASNRKSNDKKNPGITMSPRPRSESAIFPVVGSGVRDRGNKILMGPSRFFATVTMTSVPKLVAIGRKQENEKKSSNN